MTDHELALKSIRLRKRTLEIIFHAGAGHTGGGLSCLDILNVLYNRVLRVSPQTFHDPNRDRYVQSKGHSVEALYAVLADRGFFPKSDLETLCRYQSPYVGHPTRQDSRHRNEHRRARPRPADLRRHGARGKMDTAPYRVFTLLGDGELAEGSNWEAAMAAAHYDLDNLTAIIDHNTLQITGHTRDVCSNEPLDEKWRAFGWAVKIVNGHDFAELTDALSKPAETGKPTCVIANTIKGKGVSFMENVAKWHHGVPSEAELKQAI